MFTNIDVNFLSIVKFANYRTKEPFVSPANKALVGTQMSIGDVIDIFAIGNLVPRVLSLEIGPWERGCATRAISE